jgi:hypothetical protein
LTLPYEMYAAIARDCRAADCLAMHVSEIEQKVKR